MAAIDFPFQRYYRIAVPILLFVSITALLYFINNVSANQEKGWNFTFKDLLFEITVTGSFCIVLSEITYLVGNHFLDRIAHNARPYRSFFYHFLIMLAIFSILLFIYIYINVKVWGDEVYTEADEISFWWFIVFLMLLSIFLSTLHAVLFFIGRWIRMTSESAELRVRTAELAQTATQAQLSALKSQIDPHFVFNNFSVLSELILEDQQQAVRFLESLAKVYRYIISSLNTDLIPVSEEIRFLESYTYLISIRHGANVRVIIRLDEQHKQRLIPPATLQTLVENAIKHNIASDEAPLEIRIFVQDGNIHVVNKLNRVRSDVPSTRIGLQNIISRYRLLSDRTPTIEDGPEDFRVILPLIENLNK